MTPSEEALDLCQQMALTTRFTDCNNGVTLPLEIAKKCALIAIQKVLQNLEAAYPVEAQWMRLQKVKTEIEKL